MEKKQLAELAQKYLDGLATEEEIQLLHEWYDAADEDGVEIVSVSAENESGENIEKRGLLKLQGIIYNDIHPEKNANEERLNAKEIKLKRPVKWMAAASVFLLMSSVTLYFLLNRSGAKQIAQVTKEKAQPGNNISPGGNKANLMFGDGSIVVLEEVNDGIIKTEAGTEISKQKDEVIYRPQLQKGKTGNLSFNTLSTPRGGQYKVVLPDGSKVWLNAASSLKFPAFFTGKERRVTLTGEAYFEVAKNAAMPFRVAANNMQVEVLGTHFDIMSYADEVAVNTTLLEGSVKVSGGTAISILKPGEQASLNKASGRIKISDADTEQAVAWKNGLFQFEGETIQTVMKQVARWYDVEVVYKGTFSTHFRGMISRNADISKVIKMLELASGVHFKIDGKKITVTS